MPLTAVYADAGVLDLTSDTVHDDVPWSALHRARPRPPLTCRECGHGLHAKVSRTGMRFFAHDAGAPMCALAGESLAHRLLKVELASAIRAAGWHAELEVAGDGWRADVLATSPDGTVRMAWEAQLAAATIDELTERTATMTASGLRVCWITDKDRPFIGHVPSVRIRGDEPETAGEAPTNQADDLTPRTEGVAEPDPATRRHEQLVIDGLGTFRPDWCSRRSACSIRAQHGLGGDRGPCPGHGGWGRPDKALTLPAFVAGVLAGSIRLHTVRAERPWELGRHRPGLLLWTTRPHHVAEQEQVDAGERCREWHERRDAALAPRRQAEADHHAAVAALLARQKALTGPAVELVRAETGGYVGVRDATPDWAMGVPLFVQDFPQAVISPVASRVKGDMVTKLEPLTVIVATEAERARLAKVCAPGQRFAVFDVDVPVAAPPSVPGITVQQAVRTMFGGFRF